MHDDHTGAESLGQGGHDHPEPALLGFRVTGVAEFEAPRLACQNFADTSGGSARVRRPRAGRPIADREVVETGTLGRERPLIVRGEPLPRFVDGEHRAVLA